MLTGWFWGRDPLCDLSVFSFFLCLFLFLLSLLHFSLSPSCALFLLYPSLSLQNPPHVPRLKVVHKYLFEPYGLNETTCDYGDKNPQLAVCLQASQTRSG